MCRYVSVLTGHTARRHCCSGSPRRGPDCVSANTLGVEWGLPPSRLRETKYIFSYPNIFVCKFHTNFFNVKNRLGYNGGQCLKVTTPIQTIILSVF